MSAFMAFQVRQTGRQLADGKETLKESECSNKKESFLGFKSPRSGSIKSQVRQDCHHYIAECVCMYSRAFSLLHA